MRRPSRTRHFVASVVAATLLGVTAAAATSRVVGPPVGAAFQYQLQATSTGAGTSGGIDRSLCTVPFGGGPCVRPRVFDIDLYGPNGAPDRAAVASIHRAGGYAICYVDAGTWENWRPDARRFPATLLGRSNGWPGERWLDVRHRAVLLGIMATRVARCAAAGFDAVEFDNVDGYSNATGFAITAADQLRYDEALAALAHRDHLAVGLKNDFAQAATLESHFDFALDESCVQYQECASLVPFRRAGKAVYDVEYEVAPSRFCAAAAAAGVTAIAKALSLTARPWSACPLHHSSR